MMWPWEKNGRRDAITIEILKGLKNLDTRIRLLEKAHNELCDEVEKFEAVQNHRSPMDSPHSGEI
jgi:hypothetical protein